VRRTDDDYSIYCSNYACGPDSFTLHFYRYIMEGRPYVMIETDGHTGDAGTKTRIEAFLYCVENNQKLSKTARAKRPRNRLGDLDRDRSEWLEVRDRDDLFLIPPMGGSSHALAAVLRSDGFRAEVLPMATREILERGHRYTSGKECVPLTLVLGSLLDRIERNGNDDEHFAVLMPTSCGPCRFGVYNLFHKMILERIGWKDRVRVTSPNDEDYFAGLSTDLSMRMWIGTVAADVLVAALHHVRPSEREPGAAQEVFDRQFAELMKVLERPSMRSLSAALREVTRGIFGVRDLIRRAASEFVRVNDFRKKLPTVGVVGEIYVRLNPFANDGVLERLEKLGVRTRLAPSYEWLEYTAWLRKFRMDQGRPAPGDSRWGSWFTDALQNRVTDALYTEMGRALRWGSRTKMGNIGAAGKQYVDPNLHGEAILTVGTSLHEYLNGEIDGVISVGPLECMPNKIAESHFQRTESDYGLPSLTLSLNGDPVDPQIIEAFVFEVKEHLGRLASTARPEAPSEKTSFADILWRTSGYLVTSALGLTLPTRSR
jgi:predicted nucleotide-binding protein (sugar kinase/HSP70/actin superfamily)